MKNALVTALGTCSVPATDVLVADAGEDEEDDKKRMAGARHLANAAHTNQYLSVVRKYRDVCII